MQTESQWQELFTLVLSRFNNFGRSTSVEGERQEIRQMCPWEKWIVFAKPAYLRKQLPVNAEVDQISSELLISEVPVTYLLPNTLQPRSKDTNTKL